MPSGLGDTYWYAVGAGNFGWLANPLFLLHWWHTFRCGYRAAYCSQLSSTRWEWWSPGIIPTDQPPVVVLVLLCLMLKSWWFWILDMIKRSYSTARYEFGCLVSQHNSFLLKIISELLGWQQQVPHLMYDSDGVGSPSQSAMMKVAKLVDNYLAEIAPDANLKLTKFIALAEILPEYARVVDDGLYRAIDIYLKVMPTLCYCCHILLQSSCSSRRSTL